MFSSRRCGLTNAFAFFACLICAALTERAVAEDAPRFPLELSENGQHLVDQAGRPFLLHGDTAWSLIVQLSPEEIDAYLDDRRDKGFNTILVNLIEHRFADDAPRNRRGDEPFTTPGDLSTPNDKYFAYADEALRKASERGICVLLTPAYLGYGGGDDGWFQKMKAGGRDKLRDYGRYVGRRYRDFSNVIWVMGGDFTPDDADKWTMDELAAGIREADPNHLMTAHLAPDSPPLEALEGRAWLDLNNAYSYEEALYRATLREHQRQPRRAFFLMESAYEREHDASPARIRRQAYWPLFSGACGQLFGNNPMWHFDCPCGLFAVDKTWQESLDGVGSREMQRLGEFFRQQPWERLVPDTDHKLLVDGHGEFGSTGYSLAARTLAGDRGLVYVADGAPRSLNLDLSLMCGAVTAAWFDPTSGKQSPIDGSPFDNHGRRAFTAPTANAAGDGDFVLVLAAE